MQTRPPGWFVEPETPALQAITEHYGEQILQEDGSLDRRALRNIIFNDDEERRWLEALLHPLIKEEMLYAAVTVPVAVQHYCFAPAVGNRSAYDG